MLSRKSESSGGSFSARKKSNESQNSKLGFQAEEGLGSVGGIKAEGRLTVGIDNLIGQQGVKVEYDAKNKTVGFDAGVGSTKSKLGISLGGEVKVEEDGTVTIRRVKGGVNIAGFGIEGEADAEGGVAGTISIFGLRVGAARDAEGKPSLTIGYAVPGGEISITFSPDEEKKTEEEAEEESEEEPDNPGAPLPPLNVVAGGSYMIQDEIYDSQLGVWMEWGTDRWAYFRNPPSKQIPHKSKYPPDVAEELCHTLTKSQVETMVTLPGYEHFIGNWFYGMPDNEFSSRKNIVSETTYIFALGRVHQKVQTYYRWYIWLETGEIFSSPAIIYAAPGDSVYTLPNWGRGTLWEFTDWVLLDSQFTTLIRCDEPPEPPEPPPGPPPLPNPPQKRKKMNCCEKVEEIYKYLGIAKIKRNKFKVGNQMMVPGGKGNSFAHDYYEVTELLFKTLANGLILNPKSKPLGTPFQHSNATAWAAQIYEMSAESMGNGNSTQKYEMSSIMQMTQMMAAVAELSRKVDFLQEAIGILPVPKKEELAVCFTVYEGHKGYGKKDLVKIDITKAKTDDQVERVLATMLQPSLIPIVRWEFSPDRISIAEAINRSQA